MGGGYPLNGKKSAKKFLKGSSKQGSKNSSHKTLPAKFYSFAKKGQFVPKKHIFLQTDSVTEFLKAFLISSVNELLIGFWLLFNSDIQWNPSRVSKLGGRRRQGGRKLYCFCGKKFPPPWNHFGISNTSSSTTSQWYEEPADEISVAPFFKTKYFGHRWSWSAYL